MTHDQLLTLLIQLLLVLGLARVFGDTDYEARPCGKYRFGDTRHICSDITKLQALGWSPRRTIEDSVNAYRDWLRAEDVAEDILEYSNRQMASLGVVRDINASTGASKS